MPFRNAFTCWLDFSCCFSFFAFSYLSLRFLFYICIRFAVRFARSKYKQLEAFRSKNTFHTQFTSIASRFYPVGMDSSASRTYIYRFPDNRFHERFFLSFFVTTIHISTCIVVPKCFWWSERAYLFHINCVSIYIWCFCDEQKKIRNSFQNDSIWSICSHY